MKKKLLSILVVLAMVVAIMPMTVFAESEQIGDYTFDKSTGTITRYTGTGVDLEIPATLGEVNVTSIGNNAFSECTSLASVTIPEGVTSIGAFAFNKCTSLASVTIPSSIRNIGRDAFQECANLKSLNIDSVESWCAAAISGHPFAKSKGGRLSVQGVETTSLVIPKGVESIGTFAFSNCIGLTSVTISEDVTSIGSSAFAGCIKLASVTIPSRVTGIGNQTFSNCKELKTILVKAANPPSWGVGGQCFQGCSELSEIYVPEASVDDYTKATGWKIYAEKINGAYMVNVAPSENGIVTVDKDWVPAEGTEEEKTVTITATPDKGYELAKLIVKDASGKEVKVTDNKFVMPASDVTVTAEFTVKEEIPKTGDANNMLLWVVLALVAAGLAAGTVLKVKKTNK